MSLTVEIKKQDQDEQLVFGEVYVPNVTDSQGDRMSAEEIKKTAYLFMERMRLNKVDTDHDQKVNGSFVVESFIARDGDPTFIPGSWVIGVKVPDAGIWQKIKKGELNGFSFDGMGIREEVTVEVNVPESLTGLSDRVEDHAHQFQVRFDPATGAFLGGETDVVNGHSHKIVKGTVTEAAAGHTHRFSYVEELINAR
jgi:hypothetical protein